MYLALLDSEDRAATEFQVLDLPKSNDRDLGAEGNASYGLNSLPD